jgi:hypothetical protein
MGLCPSTVADSWIRINYMNHEGTQFILKYHPSYIFYVKKFNLNFCLYTLQQNKLQLHELNA